MKNIKIFFTLLIISALSFLVVNTSVNAITATTTTISSEYNTPIAANDMYFKAEYIDWNIKTSWRAYDKDEKLKYYKVIRSTTNTNPIYPEDGYIKYSSDINFTEYLDTNVPIWTSYYRVCAITYENNRYCSNVVKTYRYVTWDSPVVCTADAKVCPDGSYVSRTGPNCEFAVCEEENPLICTMEYAPVCAQPPMPTCPEWMICAQVIPAPKTYSNKCVMANAKAKYLYSWECKDIPVSIWGDKDEHGCYTSAWYSWCDAKNKCLRTWEEKCEAETPVVPKNCVSWYDGCNTCGAVDWELTYCTERYCVDSEKTVAKCIEYKAAVWSQLSSTTRWKVDTIADKFVEKVEEKYEKEEDRVRVINNIIDKLAKLKYSNSKTTDLINYLKLKLEEKVESYEDVFSDIEDIFGEY